jgi:CBS domain-containing protein
VPVSRTARHLCRYPHTIESVRSASISLGKLFGVQIRMHALLLAALALAIVWAHFVGAEPLRGLLLWLALLLAVAVGEIARALTGAYCGFTLRRVLLLPAGGGSTFVTPPNSRTPRALLLAAPLANMAFGLVIAGIIVTLAPQVVLLDPHWVTPLHLLRSLVWLNLVLGVVNLLPSSAQDRAAFGISAQSAERTPGAPPAILASGVPLAAIVAGMVFLNWWIVFGGLGLLLVAQFLREQPTPGGKAAQPIRVRDVMLTDFAVLSASATLGDALALSRHTLQEIFPIVRGDTVVGAVARQQVETAFATRGESYLQGIMVRTFATALPDDALPDALDRLAAESGASPMLVPVLEPGSDADDRPRIVGILTPHHLRRSVQLFTAGVQAAARRASAQSDEQP